MALINREAFAHVTPKLVAICFFLSVGSLIFGYDTGSFSGVQAIPSFVRQFGEQTPKGEYAISPSRISLMSSIAFTGKFCGTLVAGPIIERFGHHWCLYIMCALSFVGVVVEATSTHYAQFTVGRIILYASVGLVENAVPTYQTELAPAPVRGAIVASIQLAIGIAQLLAAIINKIYSTSTEPKGWLIPTCVQGVFPLVLLCGLPFVPWSPRWLISRGRHEQAAQTLRMVRPPADVQSGACEEEVREIQYALNHEVEKGPWRELFQGTNLRRTMIATGVFILQQFTGQSFVSQYGPRFYKSVGLGPMAFTYQIISNGVTIVTCCIGMYLIERIGRRLLLLWGAILQACFLLVVAGMGQIKNPSVGQGKFMAFCVIMFASIFNGTWGLTPYVLASEIGTGRLREKTMAFSSTVNVVAAFIVSFTLPYLLNAPYAALGAGVGWIYGGFAVIAALFTFFFVPETGNRSLEELDECFESGVSARNFSSYRTSGHGAAVYHLEQNRIEDEKEACQHVA